MKFRTEITVKKQFELNPKDSIFALGSCFADRMGNELTQIEMDCAVNPFGVIYNPLSIAKLIRHSIDPGVEIPEWQKSQGHWVNILYHGSLSDTDKDLARLKAGQAHDVARSYLEHSDLLIITFGTAFAWIDKATCEVATNCHRLPGDSFTRRLLSKEEIITVWQPLLSELKQHNPKLKIIFTVSPVRHVRDSLVKNQHSKATLIMSVHELCESEGVHYFPSYEILMDDLRDYRYYEDNLVQPNSQALEYITEKFADFCYTEKMFEFQTDVRKVKKRLSHKVMKTGLEAELFMKETDRILEEFYSKYPFLNEF